MATITIQNGDMAERVRRLEELLAEKEGRMTAAWDAGRRRAASQLFDECVKIKGRLAELAPEKWAPKGLPAGFEDNDPDGDHACEDLKISIDD